MQAIIEPSYPPLPETFRPELLRRLTLREVLLLAAQYGLVQIAERVSYDEFVKFFRKQNKR
jgi:hypothetical protein